MDTISCPHCGQLVEISKAFLHQIEEQARAAISEKHALELEKAKKRGAEEKLREMTEELALKEKERIRIEELQKEKAKKMQEDYIELMEKNRKLQERSEDQEIIMKKQLMVERERMQEEISKKEHEKASLEKRELEKQLEDMKKALEEANRKGSQKSQQLQGEVLELEIEEILKKNFPHDDIEPVGKGVKGADIRHLVKSPRGFKCGLILWEFKRRQDWSDKWISKLKEDGRATNADISVIVTTNLPKDMKETFMLRDDIWICTIDIIVPLGIALRKSLLDVGYQKAIAMNRGDKADALYAYVTSKEFIQQLQAVMDVYTEMNEQVHKERASFEKIWKQREAQAQRLMLATSGMVGSIKGKIGQGALHIPDLELLEGGDEEG